MKQKNIFLYQLFLSLIFQILVYFCGKVPPLSPPSQKGHPFLSHSPPLKIKVLLSPSFWTFDGKFNPTPNRNGFTLCVVHVKWNKDAKYIKSWRFSLSNLIGNEYTVQPWSIELEFNYVIVSINFHRIWS